MIIAVAIVFFIFGIFVWSLLAMAAASDQIPGVNEPNTYHSDGKKYRR